MEATNMNEQNRIEWGEMREYCKEPVPFFVDARETPQGWCFLERESWDFQSHEASPSPEGVFIANYAKEAIARGSLSYGSDFCLVRIEEGGVSRYAMFRERGSSGPSLQAMNRMVLTRVRFFRTKIPVPASRDEARPRLAA
jgi:hypothetical protein